MTPASGRIPAQILRSRGSGACVGTLIGASWMVFGLQHAAIAIRILLGSLGLVTVLWLLSCSGRLFVAARRLPSPDASARAASRRVWTWFSLNLVAEIVLLNVAVAALTAPALHIYWIPVISLVVGLHFLPMAVFFGVSSYWACGGAMVAVAVAVCATIHRDPSLAQSLIADEAVCNALILWATVAWGVFTIQHA